MKWYPEYKRANGQPDRVEIFTTECPQCLISPASEWLLDLYHGSQFPSFGIGGSAPAILFGANIAKWPAWWHDAMSAITSTKHAADAIEIRK